jgi:hypothetical protein
MSAPFGLGVLEEADAVAADQGMNHGVQPFQRLGIAQHRLAERLAVDAAVLDHPGKSLAHRPTAAPPVSYRPCTAASAS